MSSPKCWNKSGFTVLEVLAAVLILGLAYVAVLQNFSLSMRNLDKVVRERTTIFQERVSLTREAKYTGQPAILEEEEGEGTLFMEGHGLRLLLIASESGELVTLKLEKL